MPPPKPSPAPRRSKRHLAQQDATPGGPPGPRDADPFNQDGGAAFDSGAFNPEGEDRGRQQHVFDSSQTSRRGSDSKRKKTSFVVTPIRQGGIPGDVPGDSVATTPNGSGNRGRGRLAAMRRR